MVIGGLILRRFLTLFLYKDISKVHLYKDVGGIPYALAKYCNWKTAFAYVNYNGTLKDLQYEKYVTLIPIFATKNNIIQMYTLFKFIWNNAQKYDVINLYHGGKKAYFIAAAFKLINSHIKVYVKLDMGRRGIASVQEECKEGGIKYKIKSVLARLLYDCYTVEANKYVDILNSISYYRNRVKYLPNGFFGEIGHYNFSADKKNIILTVGRLGSYSKNTELLVNVFSKLDRDLIRNWKLYLVGSRTFEFDKFLETVLLKYPYLKEHITCFGEINDKNLLATIYEDASIFVLPSRWEGFPLSLIEAMSHGCIPIVTDCCDAYSDLISDSRYGYIIENESETELLRTISDILKMEKEQRKMIGVNAQMHAWKYFSWKNISSKLDAYLRDIYL